MTARSVFAHDGSNTLGPSPVIRADAEISTIIDAETRAKLSFGDMVSDRVTRAINLQAEREVADIQARLEDLGRASLEAITGLRKEQAATNEKLDAILAAWRHSQSGTPRVLDASPRSAMPTKPPAGSGHMTEGDK